MLDLQTSWSPVVLMGSSLWVHHKGRGQLWGLANHWPATSLHQIGASLWSFLDPSIHCPNGPLSFLDPPPWCLTVVRNGEMREKRRNLKRPATSFTWSEMMSKLKKKATAVPSRGWSDARQKLGLALEIVLVDLWTGESYASIANQLWHKVRGMTWLCVCCTLRSADSISEVHGS